MESTTSNISYTPKVQGGNIDISIPTSIYTQKESRLIIIHRDTLQILIQDFLAHFVDWGTTISLIIAVLSMITAAATTCNEQMEGKNILLLVLYVIFGTLFAKMSVNALIKHWHHRDKNINTLMTDIDKACNKPASQTESNQK